MACPYIRNFLWLFAFSFVKFVFNGQGAESIFFGVKIEKEF